MLCMVANYLLKIFGPLRIYFASFFGSVLCSERPPDCLFLIISNIFALVFVSILSTTLKLSLHSHGGISSASLYQTPCQ